MDGDILINKKEEFEEVIPGNKLRFNFPAVYFFKPDRSLSAYFNKLAVPMMADAERVQVKMSSRFIVFLPSESKRHNSFSRTLSHAATLSVGNLIGIVPEGAAFRCYPYKGGIAIERDKPIWEDAK